MTQTFLLVQHNILSEILSIIDESLTKVGTVISPISAQSEYTVYYGVCFIPLTATGTIWHHEE